MEVLIAGAGVAGPTLAYWLQRIGHAVTIVERAPELRRGGYLVDFWGAGFEVAERMGLVPELRRRGYSFSEARAVDAHGRRLATIKPARIMGGSTRYVSIARSDLAAAIYAALDGKVELILDDSVAALVERDHGIQVDFESRGQRRFDLVVGADGLHSRVRQLAFGAEESFEKYLGIVFAVFQAKGYRPRNELAAMMYAGVGFQAVRISVRDDVTLFLLTARHTGPIPANRAAQEVLLRDRLRHAGWETRAMLDLMPTAETFYFDVVSQIRMPSWTRGRVALVGDAAAAPSFLAGQGSALAMVEAYVLAAELARSADHRDAFRSYEQRLGSFLRSKQDAAVGLGAAFAPESKTQLLVRNGVMRLMGLPKVADVVMGRSFRDAVELPAMPAVA